MTRNHETSEWIPSSRIVLARALALGLGGLAALGSRWSPLALALLPPALAAAWVAMVLLMIRHQLSPRGGGWEQRIHAAVLARLPLAPGSQASLLDIGCGDASLLVALLERWPGLTATGVDLWGANWRYSQASCELRTSSRGLNARFRRMNAGSLEFPDDSFDSVVSVMCFHEVRSDPGAAVPGPLAALIEGLRVLRPGGAFVLIDRFGSKRDYGDAARLHAILDSAADWRREPLVATLKAPWPLSTARSLGAVEILAGVRKADPLSNSAAADDSRR